MKHNITAAAAAVIQEWILLTAALVVLEAVDLNIILLFHTVAVVVVAMNIHKLTLIRY
jgi:hypothetical protein